MQRKTLWTACAGAYYQAYRNTVLRELEEAKNRLAATTSATNY